MIIDIVQLDQIFLRYLCQLNNYYLFSFHLIHKSNRKNLYLIWERCNILDTLFIHKMHYKRKRRRRKTEYLREMEGKFL